MAAQYAQDGRPPQGEQEMDAVEAMVAGVKSRGVRITGSHVVSFADDVLFRARISSSCQGITRIIVFIIDSGVFNCCIYVFPWTRIL